MSGKIKLNPQIKPINWRRYEHLSSCTKTGRDPCHIIKTPLPLRACDQVVIQSRIIQHPQRLTQPSDQKRDVVNIEKRFRRTLSMRLETLITETQPLDMDRKYLNEQVSLNMVQLAHEWGIHVTRAQTITEQIVRELKIKHRQLPKKQPKKWLAQKSDVQQRPRFSASKRNSLLAVLIALGILVDLAIVWQLF
jgi:hypothetical protein